MKKQKSTGKNKTEMNDKNGNGNLQNPQDAENVRLKRFLQKTVKKESASESLREKIRQMIRE